LIDALSKVRPRTEAIPVAVALTEAQNIAPATPHALTATNGAAQQAIDHSVLDELLEMGGGDREFLAEMIDSYLSTAPSLLEKLRASASTGDAASLRLAAHTLKSGSKDMGANALATLFAHLETLGHQGETEGTSALVTEAETLFSQVAAELEAVRNAG
jgi:HPt (histidine-containing phosphotransfer) domain-containing protein